MKISRNIAAALLAVPGLLLAPVPAHAATVCGTASNGAQYCYDNGAGTGGSSGGSATPSPAPVSADQASSAEPFNPAPVLVLGGVMLAVILAWLIRPARTAAARIVARSADR